MRRLVSGAAAISLALGMLAACNMLTGKDDADAVARQLYGSLQHGDYERAVSFYSPRFFEKTPKDDWVKNLKTVSSRLGDLREFQLQTWNVQKNVGTGAAGTFYQLQYRVTYARYPATETLVLYRPLSGGDIKVLGHQINSEGFLR
ncbi:MAG TPA: DUF4019 domain-containing protein [Methylomirabilota bacterium]|jgi:hypothetical protein